MRLRTQFIITMLLFGIILSVIAASAIITDRRVEKVGRQERIAAQIAQGASELSYLANDYLIYRESQQLKRWQSRFAAFSTEVAALLVDRPEQQALASNIQANKDRFKEVFDSAASALESPYGSRSAALDPAFLQVSWSRMAVQSQGLAADASRLSQLLHQQMDELRNKRTVLIYVMVALFGLFLIVSYVLTYRRILESITTLRAGTAVIGSGNLDFVIEEKRDDEIGELSHAFNRMTADLKEVTASKADLEREMTERKQAEKALRESEEHYRSLFDNMLNGYAYCRMLFEEGEPQDFIYLNVNQAFETLTGLRNVTGKKVSEVIPGIRESDPELFEIYGRVATTGTPERFETYVEALRMWFSISVYSPRKEHFVAVFDVITEQKEAEQKTWELLAAVQQERDRLSALIDSMTDEVWFADTKKQFTLANPSALREFGIGTSDRTIDVEKFAASLEVYRPDGSPRLVEEAPPLRALQGEVVRNQEEIIRIPSSGELRYRQVNSSPVRDARGNIIGSVSVVRDINERKQMEEELRRSRDEMEVLVSERTTDLAQRNKELTMEIVERLKMEQALQESKEQLRILASQILSAQENERKRIALEVHDVLGSSLSAIKFKVEEALLHLPKDGTLNISKPLGTLIPLIQDTIEEVRRIQADLRPPLLDDLGIVPTLSWFCRRFETIYSGVKVEQEVTVGEKEVPDHLKIVLFRITQEAMNNIGKHAQGDSVYLGLRKVDGAIELLIKDNGNGFDHESLSSREISKKGMGFSSMKERVEFSGGSFGIESVKGKGTVIRALWPA